ncbi:BTAD domain-containing putative transcriptional regulator [Iamia majanohamensis]|uniref:BTAD domain-containing putative transcriptional regulator n=1 Tax=Iamia majanohamensis TaxID=467976 RepID=A0AAE9YC18_9ACTN|nr:BTAD domain-containing putative transcriptional regulator [Iamia majanohamensis]WCO68294.1 BTAD domain-containing putative transcriptional regulator [Iamia majanohamensis]
MSSVAPPQPLEVSVLGPVRARRAGEDLVLGGRRQRAVLARLALAGGEAVPAARVIDELWLGDPPPSATNTLQSYVSNLRRVLRGPEGQVIERAGDAYRLALPPEALAAARFEALVRGLGTADDADAVAQADEALALWHGPAVADFADEPWAQGDAVRLEELRLAAMEERFDALLASGGHSAAVADLEAAAAAHPLRERFAGQLVLALYRCGRQAEALRAYERTRSHLADELGLDPGPDLVRLADAVLVHDPDLLHAEARVPAADPVARVEATPAAPRARGVLATGILPLPPAVDERRGRTDFVGRDAEMAALEQQWDLVTEGDRRLVLLTGEPGVGKTRLAQRLARMVHEQGGPVLWGRCAAENLIAYQPIAEAVRTAVRMLHPELVRTLIDPRPALGLVLHDTVPSIERAERSERFALYDSLADLTGEVSAAAPVLLVVDDLQWADASTLALLQQVLVDHRSGRLLVLATLRRPAGRPTEEVDRLLADLHRDHLVASVEVEGLSAPDVGALLRTRGVELDAAAVDAVRDRTAGNPFFIEALVDHGDDLVGVDGRSLPTTVRDVLDSRLAAIPADDARVLTAAAIIGLRVDLDLLAEVSGTDPDDLLDVVDRAVASGLLAEDEDLGWVTFPHALVRQALVARTSRNREARIHLAVGSALEARPASPDRAPRVAQHLLAAGRACPPGRAARGALAAAGAAASVAADAEARTWARRAAEVLEGLAPEAREGLDTEADLVVAASSRNLAEVDVARAAVERVHDRAAATGDGLLLARAAQEQALLVGGVGFSFGAVDQELLGRLEEALAALPADHPTERSVLLSWMSIALTGADDQERQAPIAAEAWTLAEGVADRPDVVALAAFARHLAHAGPDGLAERQRVRPVLLEATRDAGWGELELVGLVLGVVDLLEADRVPESEAALEAVRSRLAAGDPRPLFDVYVHFIDAAFALLRGDLAEAEAASARGLEQGEAAHGGNATQAWAGQQYMLANYRSQLGGLIPVVEAMVEEFPTMAVWRVALATCQANAGLLEAARDTYRRTYEGDALPLPQSSTWYTTVCQLAELAWNLDDADLAARLLPLTEPVADRVAVTGMGAVCIGHVARHHGLVLAVLRRDDEAVELLERARRRAEECGFGPWLVRTQVELAAVRERRGGPGDGETAAALRAEAQEGAARLGVHPSLLPDDLRA